MMRAFRSWYWRQQFVPGGWALLVNPFYFARRGLLAALREFLPALRGRVLDVGCGRKPYRAFVPAVEYVGIDMDNPANRRLGAADVYYDGSCLPFADASFDGVLCSQVLEHVFEPERFLRDIGRVLRPGGLLVLATPFAWDEHEQPYDFGRYSSFGLRALLERCGFVVVVQRKTNAGAATIVQLASGYLFKITRTRSRVLNGLAQVLLIAPCNLLGALAAAILPRTEDLYLDNVVLARRPDAKNVP